MKNLIIAAALILTAGSMAHAAAPKAPAAPLAPGCLQAEAVLPEPASASLLGLGATLFLRRARR